MTLDAMTVIAVAVFLLLCVLATIAIEYHYFGRHSKLENWHKSNNAAKDST